MSKNAHPAMDFTRQAGLVDMESLSGKSYTLIGAGGIGSPTAALLTCMGVTDLTVIDRDFVEPVNKPSQLHPIDSIGAPKAEVTAEVCRMFSGAEVDTIVGEFNEDSPLFKGVVISGVDSMAVRQTLFDHVKKSPEVELYIEARMGAQVGRVYVLDPNDKTAMDRYQEEYLYPDEGADPAPCTERAIVYTTWGAATIIGMLVKKYANKEPLPSEVLVDYASIYLEANGLPAPVEVN